jgi:6-phosphogluconolactonase
MRHITVLLLVLSISFQLSAKNYQFLIGTFTTNTPAKGIFSLTFNENDLSTNVQLLTEAIDPSFLCISKNKKLVYAVSERGAKSSVAAYKFNKKNKLQLINKVDAGSVTDPCHIAMTDYHVVTANYSGGSIFVYKRNADGSLSDVVQKIQHEGKSIHPTRQTKPHTHQVVFSPDSKFLLTNDLGIDNVLVYKYDKMNSENPFSAYDTLEVKPGSGPRHLTFDKSGTIVYLLQELDGTVSTIQYENCKLTLMDTTTVVRKNNIQTGAADIHLSPDGKFLYATNRGSVNDITCFATSPAGKLTFVQQVSTEGEGPRNFAITNDGNYILVGNQRTNNISIFSRNKKTGELTFTGKKIQVGAPVCILEY